MITSLSRKQVKAFIDTLSKDSTRENMYNGSIQKFDNKTFLVAGKGEYACLLNISNDFDERLVKRDELIKWYKLSTNKDVLSIIQLYATCTGDAIVAPPYHNLLKDEIVSFNSFSYSGEYITRLETIADKPLSFYFRNKVIAVAIDDESIYLIAGRKR